MVRRAETLGTQNDIVFNFHGFTTSLNLQVAEEDKRASDDLHEEASHTAYFFSPQI